MSDTPDDSTDDLTVEGRPWSNAAKAAIEQAERELPEIDPRYDSPRVQYLISASGLLASKQQFEAGWVGQRMSWLVISQSFLFNAFAAAAGRHEIAELVFLKWLVPVVGLTQAVATYLSILAASRVDGELYKTRSVLDLGLRLFAPGMRQLPPLGDIRIGRLYRTRQVGALASRLLPVTLICAWTLLVGVLILGHWHPALINQWLLTA